MTADNRFKAADDGDDFEGEQKGMKKTSPTGVEPGCLKYGQEEKVTWNGAVQRRARAFWS